MLFTTQIHVTIDRSKGGVKFKSVKIKPILYLVAKLCHFFCVCTLLITRGRLSRSIIVPIVLLVSQFLFRSLSENTQAPIEQVKTETYASIEHEERKNKKFLIDKIDYGVRHKKTTEQSSRTSKGTIMKAFNVLFLATIVR